jgi:phenylacetate-CoA ligase
MTLHPTSLDPDIEAAPPEVLHNHQHAALLRAWPALQRAWPHLHDVAPTAPLFTQPLTDKAMLRAGYPLDRLAVPRAALRRIHASSGTSGVPTVVAYTADDLALWARLVGRGLAAVGVGAGSRVHSALGYGLFTGGLGFHAAAEALGACVVPAAAGNAPRHRRLLADLDAEVLLATPSYAMHLAESADGPLPAIPVGIFGAEPLTAALRDRLEAAWGMVAYDTYGLSEAIGPGVAWECPAKTGLHVNADAFIAEIIDPHTLAPLPDGVVGELVLTAPLKQAMPLLRYRTGDLTAIDRAPCPCGRTLPRLIGIRGRTDEMLTVRGVNVYPSQIEATLLAFSALRSHWHATVTRPKSLDLLLIEVEADDLEPSFCATVAARLQDMLGVRAEVRLLAPGALPIGGGKARRLQDAR